MTQPTTSTDSTDNADMDEFARTLSRTAKGWRRLMNARLAKLGMSQAKWSALLLLSRHPDGIVQRELADHMGIESASLVGLLDRMTADGWIERRPCDADRRANLVFLGNKSTHTLDEIRRVAAQVTRQLLGDIPADDLQACQNVLASIADRAQELTDADSRTDTK